MSASLLTPAPCFTACLTCGCLHGLRSFSDLLPCSCSFLMQVTSSATLSLLARITPGLLSSPLSGPPSMKHLVPSIMFITGFIALLNSPIRCFSNRACILIRVLMCSKPIKFFRDKVKSAKRCVLRTARLIKWSCLHNSFVSQMLLRLVFDSLTLTHSLSSKNFSGTLSFLQTCCIPTVLAHTFVWLQNALLMSPIVIFALFFLSNLINSFSPAGLVVPGYL